MSKKRKPWLAAIFSIIFPGLGHLYTGRILSAIAIYLIGGVLFYAILPLTVYGPAGPYWILFLALIALLFYSSVIIHSALVARKSGEEYVLRPYNRWYAYLGFVVIGVALRLLLTPAERFEAFNMPAESMTNTLAVGDYLLADLQTYDHSPVDAGDVVVFILPRDGKTKYIKRCVGLPGDTVLITDKLLFVNGKRFPDPPTVWHMDTKTQPRGAGDNDSRDNFGPYVVPTDSYFMMGDNRDNSYDSRYWGPVPRHLLIGKAIRIYYSKTFSRIGKDVE